jgi:prepilin-type N-terminal cleavage/methylation domain-containing protein
MLTTNLIRRAHRAGFTLVELLIAMTLMGIIGGAIVTLLLRQQRFYNGTNELIQTRQQIRQAAAMLPSDLRGISSVGGDIYAMTDSSIDFRSVFGSSVACTVDQGGGKWVAPHRRFSQSRRLFPTGRASRRCWVTRSPCTATERFSRRNWMTFGV